MARVLAYSDFIEWHATSAGEDGEPVSNAVFSSSSSTAPLVPSFAVGTRPCHYCGNVMTRVADGKTFSSGDHDGSVLSVDVVRNHCESCGWWMVLRENERRTDSYSPWFNRDHYHFEGILKRWKIGSKEVPISALRSHLLKTKRDFGHIAPERFERLIQDVYSDLHKVEVRHVGGPGDDGIDLYAVIADEPHAIQVKRREKLESVESVTVVRELIGSMVATGVRKGAVVTTAGRFSRAAMDLVENENVRRAQIEITLVPLNEVLSMLGVTAGHVTDIWQTV